MNPYLEQRPVWPDFHNTLVVAIKAALQPQLLPRYLAFTQDRLFVVESDRAILPDVSILHKEGARRPAVTATAALAADAPTVFELWREEFKEPVIHIIDPTAGNRVVTAIEVLSPDNKEAGPGRESYLTKREELWNNGANLVEIDLLRGSEPTVRLSSDQLDGLRPWHYLVAVTRQWPSQHEVYAVTLQRRLPRVAIPLNARDQDVVLDLQAAFARSWDEGAYSALFKYEEPPPGPLSAEDAVWCNEVLRNAGLRPTSRPKSKPKKKKP
jgi:hypothetical protein